MELIHYILPVICVITTTVTNMQDKKMQHEIEMKKIESQSKEVEPPEQASP